MYKKYRDYVMTTLGSRDLLEQLAEEAAELAQAALKMIRAYGLNGNACRCTPSEASDSLVEEIGDVEMLTDLLGLGAADTGDNPKWERWARSLGMEE